MKKSSSELDCLFRQFLCFAREKEKQGSGTGQPVLTDYNCEQWLRKRDTDIKLDTAKLLFYPCHNCTRSLSKAVVKGTPATLAKVLEKFEEKRTVLKKSITFYNYKIKSLNTVQFNSWTKRMRRSKKQWTHLYSRELHFSSIFYFQEQKDIVAPSVGAQRTFCLLLFIFVCFLIVYMSVL